MSSLETFHSVRMISGLFRFAFRIMFLWLTVCELIHFDDAIKALLVLSTSLNFECSSNLMPKSVTHIVTPFLGQQPLKSLATQLLTFHRDCIMRQISFRRFSFVSCFQTAHSFTSARHDRSQFVMRMIYGFMMFQSKRKALCIKKRWWKVLSYDGLNSDAAALL